MISWPCCQRRTSCAYCIRRGRWWEARESRKILPDWKLRAPVVNFTNILWTAFAPIVFLAKKIQSQTVIWEKLRKTKKLHIKCWWNRHLNIIFVVIACRTKLKNHCVRWLMSSGSVHKGDMYNLNFVIVVGFRDQASIWPCLIYLILNIRLQSDSKIIITSLKSKEI